MFEFIQAIQIDAAAKQARGRGHLRADLPMLADHFPGAPTLPGSIAIELAAQIAGPLAEEVDGTRLAFLGMVGRAKFRQPITLPADVEIEVTVRDQRDSAIRVVAAISVDETVVVDAELTMMMLEVAPPPAATTARDERLSRWKAAW